MGVPHYRDADGYELGLEMLSNNTPRPCRMRFWSDLPPHDVKAFPKLMMSEYPIGQSCMMCLAYRAYSIKRRVHSLTVSSI